MSLKLATQLLVQKRFVPLFTLLQTGTFNDNALKNALIAMITFEGVIFLDGVPSAMRVPVAGLIFIFPFLLVSAIAGQIADKFDRGHILRWVKRAEVFIMAIAAIGFWMSNIWILAFALGLMGAQSAFFSPTKNAVLPQWLSNKELITGNALLNGFVFVFILVGFIVGLALGGARYLGIGLFITALIGWSASEFCPPAPAPKPNLKINFEPISATWSILKGAFEAPHVLRPMLGIAWFYGLSTIFLTTFPDYVASVMNFEREVLIAILVSSTIAILFGSLTTILIGNLKLWGPESIGLVVIGIVGVSLFTGLLYLIPSPTFTGSDPGTYQNFLADPKMPVFMGSIILASLFNGIFVVPLQAMAQRRAEPAKRARLMSAGAVLLNLFTNITTFTLIGLAALKFPPKAPFLMIVILSIGVAIYSVYRWINPIKYENYVKD